MKFTEPSTLASGVRIVWMLTATIFFGLGLGMVWWPTLQTIGAIEAQAKTLYDEANQNESEIQRAAQLHAMAKRVADDVHQLSGQGSASAITAATLTLLNRESRSYGIDVQSIVPAPASSLSQAPASRGPQTSQPAYDALVGTPMEIDVRAHFRDLLAFISDLPRHNVLIDITDVSLVGSGDRSPKPVLGAKIQATIYRYQGAAEEEKANDSGSL
jgi:Tfp pilus assembly protein PilO